MEVDQPKSKRIKMESALHADVLTLTLKTRKERNIILNEIERKVFNKEYSDAEIQQFLSRTDLKEKFEKIAYVNVVKGIKSLQHVIEILKSGDDQLISDTFRKCNFFFENIQNYNPEFYCKHIFPRMSYTNRNRLLNILAERSGNTDKCEEFYKFLETTYNLKTAKIFLPYCTKNFIDEKLEIGIALSCRDLLNLKRRDNKLALQYLQEFAKQACLPEIPYKFNVSLCEYEDVIKLLLPIYPKEILLITDSAKERLNFKYGRKSSKRIIKTDKFKIIADPQFYTRCLKETQLYRYLKPDEFELFYQAFWPEFDKFDYTLRKHGPVQEHLNYYRSNDKKIDILKKIYLKCYKKNLLELDNISPNLIKLLPVNERIKFTKEKIIAVNDKYLSPIQWSKFLPTDQSIGKFKKEIYSTPDPKKRIEFIELMIESCGINEDYESVLDVLKFVNQRHRNEPSLFRKKLFSSILTYLKLKRFSEKLWNEIFQLFDIIFVNNEIQEFYYQREIFTEPVLFSLENPSLIDFDKVITYYLQSVPNSCRYHKDFGKYFEKHADKEKFVILKCGELFPKIHENLHFIETVALSSWIKDFNKFNKLEESDQISIVDFNWTIDKLNKLFEEQDSFRHILIGFLENIKYDKRAEKIFNAKLKLKFSMNYFQIILNTNPDLIKENMEQLLEKSVHPYYFQYIEPNFRKLIQIDGFKSGFRNLLLENLKNPKSIYRSESLNILIKHNWLTEAEFYEFAKNFYPISKHPEDRILFSLQKSIVNSLKFYKSSPEILKAIKLFCQGDYLKISLGALYHVCTKLPCNQIEKFLSENVNSPVSLKKHIIRLKFLIGQREKNINFLRNLWISEKNPSIRQVLMQLILSEFLETDSEFLFECIQSLMLSDKAIVEDLCGKLRLVPKELKSEYLKNCWEVILKVIQEAITCGSDYSEISRKLLSILLAVYNDIDLIELNFIEQILDDNLFKLNVKYSDTIISIAVRFIIQKENVSENLTFVVEKLKQSVKENWIDPTNYRIKSPIKYMVGTFCEEFCDEIISSKDSTNIVDLVGKFEHEIIEIFRDPDLEIYDEIWLIRLSKIYLKCEKNIVKFAEQLTGVMEKVFIDIPVFLLTKFSKILLKFINLNCNSRSGNFCDRLCNSIIEKDPISEPSALIVLNLIKKVNDLPRDKIFITKLSTLNYRSVKIEMKNFID